MVIVIHGLWRVAGLRLGRPREQLEREGIRPLGREPRRHCWTVNRAHAVGWRRPFEIHRRNGALAVLEELREILEQTVEALRAPIGGHALLGQAAQRRLALHGVFEDAVLGRRGVRVLEDEEEERQDGKVGRIHGEPE